MMKKVHKSLRLDPEVVELHNTIGSLGGIGPAQVIEALTYMLVEEHDIAGLLDYITTLEFKDGRKRNGSG